MQRIHLNLLGGYELRTVPGELLDIANKKTRALLAYLALPVGQAHSRDKLVGLLWSDRGDEQARNSLRQALAELGRAFEGTELPPLVKARDTIALAPQVVEVDATLFERLSASNELSDLQRASALYAGDLLDGFAVRAPVFEDWLRDERQRFRDLAISMHKKLACLETGTNAVAAAQRLLALSPPEEEGHRVLMRLYAEAGDITMALRQYEVCRTVLKRELDVSPSLETQALYGKIKGSSSSQFALVPEDAPKEEVRSQPASRSTKPSIAVLPFKNLSDDPEQDYLSQGITQDIITELSRFRSLAVIAISSAFTDRGTPLNAGDLARELSADFIVEGSVRRLGSRVRIAAQLINSATGNHAWAERYDRELEDIFAIQDDVVSRIAGTIEGRLAKVIAERAAARPKAQIAAYELVLQARHSLGTFDTDVAEPLLRNAIALEPGYAQAYAWLSTVHLIKYFDSFGADLLEEAVRLGLRAVALDQDDSLCHAALGYGYLFQRKFELAGVQAALASEVNNPGIRELEFRAHWLTRTGRAQEALNVLDEAIQRNPFPPSYHWENRSVVLITLQKFDEAISATNRKTRQHWWDHYQLAVCYAHLDRLPDAQAEIAELLRMRPGSTIQDLMRGEPYSNLQDAQVLITGLRKAGLPE